MNSELNLTEFLVENSQKQILEQPSESQLLIRDNLEILVLFNFHQLLYLNATEFNHYSGGFEVY